MIKKNEEKINKYGADTLRFTLTALLNPGRDVKLSESRVMGYKSFIKKIWNAANFLQINESDFNKEINFSDILLPTNQWIISELIKVSNQIEILMKKYLFHEVANVLYHFIWHVYYWYICWIYYWFRKHLFDN